MPIKYSYTTYIILVVVFALSAGSYLVLPVGSVLSTISASPAIGAMLYALFQLVRDHAAFERSLHLQDKQFQFSIGAASHMANVAFDKHVEFSEQYVAELYNTARTLFREGPSEAALNHSSDLHLLREKYAVWLTETIDKDLGDFEADLRKLGANAHFLEATTGDERYLDQRTQSIDENFKEFMRILGLGSGVEKISETSAIESLMRRVRCILGTKELTTLREHLLENASKAVRA